MISLHTKITKRMSKKRRELTAERSRELIEILKSRFEAHMHRHEGYDWDDIEKKLESDASKLWSLNEMEESGGEPDVAGFDEETGEYIFYDCSHESPKGRRSICYDREALEARKKHKPRHNVVDMAAEMGVELLTEEQYRELQNLGKFDTKTSTWVKTPAEIRKLGGAIFCDWRYGQVFTYHNGADSYYASRGFRGCIRV